MAWRHFSIVAVLVLVSGCREASPDRSRLAEGQEVFVYNSRSRTALIGGDRGRGDEEGVVLVDTGSRVMVIDDPGNEDNESRLVTVMVREGERQGVTVKAPRHTLRPLPR